MNLSDWGIVLSELKEFCFGDKLRDLLIEVPAAWLAMTGPKADQDGYYVFIVVGFYSDE